MRLLDLNASRQFLLAVDGFYAGTNAFPMRWFVRQTQPIQMLVAPATSFRKLLLDWLFVALASVFYGVVNVSGL